MGYQKMLRIISRRLKELKEVILIKLHWADKEIDYFRKSAKQTDEANQWSWWAIFGAVVIMEVIFIAKIIGVI